MARGALAAGAVCGVALDASWSACGASSASVALSAWLGIALFMAIRFSVDSALTARGRRAGLGGARRGRGGAA